MGHRLLGDCEMWGDICEEIRVQYLYPRVFGATSSREPIRNAKGLTGGCKAHAGEECHQRLNRGTKRGWFALPPVSQRTVKVLGEGTDIHHHETAADL